MKNMFTVMVEVSDEVKVERMNEIEQMCIAQESYEEAQALGIKLMDELDEVYAFRIDKWFVESK